MSIKSTKDVTRANAIAVIHAKLAQCDNRQLADILETVIHDGFSNFWIVKEGEEGLSVSQLMNIEPNDAY